MVDGASSADSMLTVSLLSSRFLGRELQELRALASMFGRGALVEVASGLRLLIRLAAYRCHNFNCHVL